ncbi:hypothetical protein VIBNIPon4_230019 [Vibrio nigripulchritudo POn4]|nr:hypothetical protein VIBNIFTn2_720027 [Vibrio nigripulchritudo FTn2]CCN64579.1 hypothetical protein VIBNIPon4_230019 [Vibrio nigripulchritudo POn4]
MNNIRKKTNKIKYEILIDETNTYNKLYQHQTKNTEYNASS